MRGELRAALWTEALKLRRSLLPRVTILAMTLAGLVSGFFMFVIQDVDQLGPSDCSGPRRSWSAEPQTGPDTSSSQPRSSRSVA